MLAAAALSAVLTAQVPPPAQQDPQQSPQPAQQGPGARIDRPLPTISGELYFEEAVQAMKGKPVRSIQVTKADQQSAAITPLDQASSESIVRGLETRIGQPFEPRKVSADCASLWSERRLVVRAYAEEIDGEIVVTYQVDLQVERYESVEFVGYEHLDLETIYALIGYYSGRRTTRTEAEAMRKLLLARYRRDGYAFCNIQLVDMPAVDDTPSTEDIGPPRLGLRILIEEGPKVTVREIDFVGNRSFPADPILGLFGTDSYLVRDARIESDPARGFVRGGAFSREVLEEDLDRLRLFYRSRGFLEATVDLADVRFTEDRTSVDLSFVIVEGPRYKVRSVKVVHITPDQTPLLEDPLYPPSEVERELKVQPGEFYDHDRLLRDQLAIEEFYGRRGHPSVNFPGMRTALRQGCRVLPPLEIYGEGPEVDIVFQVSEGSPKRLRDVVIRGNSFTRDAVIRRRFRVLPGERIDMLEVRRALRRIESTRFFQDPVTLQGPRLQIEPVPGDPDLVDLGLDVQDGPTGELRWGVGISTGIGAQAQITFNKRNFDLWNPPSSANPITAIEEILDAKAFHGGGQNLSMLLAPGSRQSQFSMTYVEPDIFGDHLDTYALRVSGQRRIRRLPDGYTSDVLGGEVGLSRNFTEFFNAGVAIRQETVEIDDLAQDATQLAFDAEGQTELRGGRISMRYRDFDDLLRPSEGIDIGLSFELIGGPFGAGENLSKWEHRADVYLPLAENEMGHRTVFHWRHFFGYAEEFGSSDDVFLTERFYMGGGNLRGFDFRRAGPTQFGRPLGGEVIYTSSYEVYFPLVATRLEGEVRDRELLRWVVFTDIGFLGLGLDDPTFGEMRASSGVGLRIEIPYLELPIALDLGWPWMYEESDDRRQLYFSISR
ncbi:MAG: BamA/TamA family outer membrane protein [Planctomycetes bacterium]|nr:BamA/TamA family outer membrane protein [Planctomycetota bacterium]